MEPPLDPPLGSRFVFFVVDGLLNTVGCILCVTEKVFSFYYHAAVSEHLLTFSTKADSAFISN